jgi:hypothetical protein
MKGIWEGDCCFFCGSIQWLERHHIFQGANRGRSEMDGFVVTLCHWCHNEPPDGVHHNKARREELKRMAQARYETEHSRDEFMGQYGRNYLED